MPFEKVVITHKFGIISQSHKKQLQERLLERRNQLINSAKKAQKKDENIINIQITEEFVKEYNEASYEKKKRLDYMCVQMFEKIKKRLVSFDATDDLNIQLAWAELSQLMQCNSAIQEECLDLFIISMEYAHLSVLQIPTLFFLAETVIYWIRTDTINQPFLRAFEIKLLKVGQLIFQRIYFYLNSDSSQNQDDLKEHLSIYLQGFDDYENAYSPYPDALFYMRYIIKVGKFITRNISVNKTLISDERDEQKSDSQTATLTSDESNEQNQLFREDRDSIDSKDSFSVSAIVSQAALILSLLNRKYSEKILDISLECLIELTTNIAKNNWIDSAHALCIIGECGKLNLKAMNSLLLISNLSSSSFTYDLSRIISNSSHPTEDAGSESQNSSNFIGEKKTNGVETWPWELGFIYAEVLAEICINGSISLIKKKALLGFNTDSNEVFSSKQKNLKGYGLIDLIRYQGKIKSNQEDNSWKIRYAAIKALVSVCKALDDKNNEEFRQTCWTSLIVCKENETNYNVLEAIKVGQISSKTEEFSHQNKSKKAFSSFSKPNHGNENIYFQMAKKINDTLVENELDQKKVTNISDFVEQKNTNSTKVNASSKIIKNQSNSSDYEDNGLKSSRFENLPIGKLINYNKWSANSKDLSSRNPSMRENYVKPGNNIKKRTTLKEEIIISVQFQRKIPDFCTRKNVDLMRIVEDQYRKEEKLKFEASLGNQ